MATKTDELIVLLRADIKGLEASLQTATQRISSFRKSADSDLGLVEGSIRRGTTALLSFAAAWATFRVGRGIVDAGIQMQGLNARMQASTGNAQIAAESMPFVRETAERLGLGIQATADGFASFSASALRAGLTFQETKEIFIGVSEAATAMRLSNERVQLVFMALSQMASKGQVSMEELRQQLGESMPGAIQLFAKAMGVGNAEFIKMVQNGEVTTRDLIKFGQSLKAEFGGAAAQAAESAQASFNRFGNAWFDLSAKMANNGFLDAITDATKRLTDKLNDPSTQDGLTRFAVLLGDIASAALTAASALGSFYAAANKAVESVGNGLFGALFGEKGRKALDDARFDRSQNFPKGSGPMDNAANSRYTGNPELDAMLAEAEQRASGANGGYTLGKTSQGESDKQRQAREKLERQREQLRNRVEGIRRTNAGELDPGRQAVMEWQAQQKQLEEALSKQAITKEEFRQAELEAELALQDKLTDVRKKANDIELNMRGKTLDSIAGLMNVFAGKNKAIAIAMLAFDKARAIAQAVMETHVAAAAALKYDPTGATSAYVTTLGYANVAAIAATGIAQLATMGAGGGSSSGAGSYSSDNSVDQGAAVSGTGSPKAVYVNFRGKTIFSQNDLRDLFDQMNETLGDNVKLYVSA